MAALHALKMLTKNLRSILRRLNNILQRRVSKRTQWLLIIIFTPVLFLCHYYNIPAYLWTEPMSRFKYELDIDMIQVVSDVSTNQNPSVKPINPHNYPVVLENDRICKTDEGEDLDIYLVFIIKSALVNFELRNVIRKTWANKYRIPGMIIKRIFVLGVKTGDIDLQQKIALESKKHGDIVQEYFTDSYLNNTIKLMAGFRWATTYCPGATFLAFMDDDYYVSTHNLVKLLMNIPLAQQENILIGYIWNTSMPFRSPYSKWYISLSEYPYRFWPPYPTAGSFIVTSDLAKKIFIASHYTKFLRFDDVFLGIILWKLKVKPIHNPNLYFYKLPYDKYKYKSVIAAHDFKDPEELNKMYIEQERLMREQDIL